jgi:hypothetical protein
MSTRPKSHPADSPAIGRSIVVLTADSTGGESDGHAVMNPTNE